MKDIRKVLETEMRAHHLISVERMPELGNASCFPRIFNPLPRSHLPLTSPLARRPSIKDINNERSKGGWETSNGLAWQVSDACGVRTEHFGLARRISGAKLATSSLYVKRQLSIRVARKPLYAHEATVCGSIAGRMAAALTIPLDVLKRRVM